jgi:hypothetical protein
MDVTRHRAGGLIDTLWWWISAIKKIKTAGSLKKGAVGFVSE